MVAAGLGSNSISWKYICPEKKFMFLFVIFFLRRGNGLTANMEVISMTRRTKEKIEIHEEYTMEMTAR